MLLKELLSEADSSDAMYQDLIDRVTKKSTDRYGFASHNSGKPYHDSEEAKEFMQKILDRLK